MTEGLLMQSATVMARLVQKKELRSVDLVRAHLDKIKNQNEEFKAFITVDEERALARAAEADRALSEGVVWGPLHGVPFSVKDMFETEGVRTTNGTKALASNVPERDATLVSRMKSAGGILLGKSNMPAQAMDIQTDNELVGPTKNPWDRERTVGGSTGGEAAALALGMTPLGVGTDIGGSVRIPAHYTGVMGFKPTEDLLPQTGVLFPGQVMTVRHMAACGPMARHVEDLELALKILAGPDDMDHRVAPVSLEEVPPRSLDSLRLLYTPRLGGLPVSKAYAKELDEVVGDLKKSGAQVTTLGNDALPFEDFIRLYGALFGVMALANLPSLVRPLLRLLGPLLLRDPITRAGLKQATANPRRYFSLLERRDAAISLVQELLGGYDAWLCPVSTGPAFPLRRRGRIHTPLDIDGESIPGNYGGVGYTCLFNLTGQPALSLPIGQTSDGLPLGIQLVGRRFEDMELLSVAKTVSRLFTPPTLV